VDDSSRQPCAKAKRIDQIMFSGMQEVTGTVPITCEYSLSKRWHKEATAIFRDGRLVLWNPNAS
jgi:hypothetical protein